MHVRVEKSTLKVLLYMFGFMFVFLERFKYKQQMVNNTILYNTSEAGHIEWRVLLSLSASCYLMD